MTHEIKFGTIVTNDINYWMCTTDYEKRKCECGNTFEKVQLFTPVIVDEETHFPKYLTEIYRQTTLDSIKPYTRIIRNIYENPDLLALQSKKNV